MNHLNSFDIKYFKTQCLRFKTQNAILRTKIDKVTLISIGSGNRGGKEACNQPSLTLTELYQ